MSAKHHLGGTVLTLGLGLGVILISNAPAGAQQQQQQRQEDQPLLPWLGQRQQQQQPQRTQPDPDVERALLSAYPGDARIRVTDVSTVNGVQVYHATVTTDAGAATARVTEHGDFLSQGQPRAAEGLADLLRQNVQALFGDAPARDATLNRTTHYVVDIPAPDEPWQNSELVYRARFDATGRLIDVQNPGEVLGEYQRLVTRSVMDQALADRVTELARPHIGPDAQIHAVFEGPGEGWYFVDVAGAGAYAIVNEQGEVLSARRQVEGRDLPVPVREAVNQTFPNAVRAFAGQELTYEVEQPQQQGQADGPVVIRVRPDGHVLGVVNEPPVADAQTAGDVREPRIDWRRDEPRQQQQQQQQRQEQDDVDQRISTPRGGIEWQ